MNTELKKKIENLLSYVPSTTPIYSQLENDMTDNTEIFSIFVTKDSIGMFVLPW